MVGSRNGVRRRVAIAGAALVLAATAAAQEPPLPAGLGGGQDEPALPAGLGGGQEDEPALPSGLGGAQTDEPGLPAGLGGGEDDEPGLPPGLGGGDPAAEEDAEAEPLGLLAFAREHGIKGFLETRLGTRTQRDPYSRTLSIAETRLRLEGERQAGRFFLRGAADLIADPLLDSWTPDLESGQGFVDLREAYASTSPLPWLDLKAGRQVLTWGTGDLLFINDVFPKDWVSFFTGRDTEYLKAPSDAIRAGIFSDLANVDLVFTPRFDPDRFIRGDRVSYFNPLLGRRAGRDAPLDPDVPDEWFDDGEWSARVYRNVGSYELAAYGYLGRWKSPGGFDAQSGRPRFPRLAVYGASARTQVAGGIANLELGYYDSREDGGGDDPFVENSQARVLVGFERDVPEWADSLTLGVQYYLEAMMQHDEFEATLPAGAPERDELRHVVTLRVTKLLLEQRLRTSLFAYVSPNDRDAYLRPTASYAVDDSWSVSVGGNLFAGERDDTFFGQFGPNTNVYAAIRFSF